MKVFFVPLICVALSALVGFWLASLQGQESQPNEKVVFERLESSHETTIRKAKRGHATELFRKRIQIREVLDLNATRADEMKSWQISAGGELYGVPRQVMTMLSLHVMDEDRRLTDDTANVLRMTREERQKADEAIWRAWVAITHEEAKHVSTEVSTQDHVKFKIGAFHRQGQAIREALMRDLTAILGEDRVDILFNKNSFHFSFNDQHFLVFGKHSNFVELRRHRKNRWSSGTLGIGFRGIQSDLLGRFYDKLPLDAQKRIKPRFRGLPTLRTAEEVGK